MKKRIHVNQHNIRKNNKKRIFEELEEPRSECCGAALLHYDNGIGLCAECKEWSGPHEEDDLPIFTVKTYKGNTLGNRVKICGESTLVYSPDKPLSCGAKVWIETEDLVTVNTGRENVDL